jgi:hypothetical protein
MKLNFGSSLTHFGKTTSDIPGFAKTNRFIILSEITSSTIPNILDMFFGLFPGGTDYLLDNTKKTRVMVINNSEVYGTYYGLSDTRTRNVFIHHGFANCKLNEIQGDTPILFTDVDWNVISDIPDAIMCGKKNGRKYDEVGEVNVSYDINMFGNTLFRQGKESKEIMIPSPEYYDEKDMVLIGDKEENYLNFITDNKENMYYMPEDKYINTLYSLKLNDLIDPNTRVCKLNINVENLSKHVERDSQFLDNFISELCANAKYALEKYGFSSGEIIYDGRNGYNVSRLKTYMNLSKIEQHINYMCVCGEIDRLNEALMDDLNAISIIMTISYANVNVRIIDKTAIIGNDVNTTSDSNVLELSNMLKTDYINMDF